jgi:hypothetical protein
VLVGTSWALAAPASASASSVSGKRSDRLDTRVSEDAFVVSYSAKLSGAMMARPLRA